MGMVKRTVGIYVVYYNGWEIGYMRCAGNFGVCSHSGVDARTMILGRYNSYTSSVTRDLDYYTNIPDGWDVTLVDKYDEYIL